MSRTDRHENLTSVEIQHLRRLEAIARRNLDTYIEVGNALASIRDERLYRDTHASFEAYARDRWGISGASAAGVSLAKVWEQALGAIGGHEVAATDIRITIRKHGKRAELQPDPAPQVPIARLVADEAIPRLRWLLAHATGTIAAVTHQLEARSALLGDATRKHLGDDVFALEEELVRLEGVLAAPVDWDAEHERLQRGEIPPFDDGTGLEEDE